MSGVWARCPRCDLEVKVEMTIGYDPSTREVLVEHDNHDLVAHVRDCVLWDVVL